MAATSFNFSVIVIPSAARSDAANWDFPTVNQSLSFALEITSPDDFDTLYSRDSKAGSKFKGLLYVPDLPEGDPCDIPDLVPRNVTRKANLPDDDLKRIAYAPLIAPECSLSYMYSAQSDNVAAFIFYGVPHQFRNDTRPLDESEYPFEYPVYYLDERIGQPLMNKLADYSANMTEVYNGFNLTEAGYDLRDYARIYAVISTRSTNPMPGLWLFLLVVIAVLLFVIGASSLLMHMFQFHYRRNLRRRIANGEVDLEALGVGRITVPTEFLNKFPVYTYKADPITSPPTPQIPEPAAARTTSPSSTPKPEARTSTATLPTPTSTPAPGAATTTTTTPSRRQSSQTPRRQSSHTTRGYSQTSCPICLDDFIPSTTSIRELPCLHIFHPECIDPYLQSQSSLCVLCKQSCLPKGYVPIKLTNAIVRRERLLRRVRARSRAHHAMQYQNGSGANGGNAAGAGGNNSIPLMNFRGEDGGWRVRWNMRRLRGAEDDLLGRQVMAGRAADRRSARLNGGGGDGRGGDGGTGGGGGGAGRVSSHGVMGSSGYYYRSGVGLSSNGSGGDYRMEVIDDPVRPRWRETMDRIFPGFR